VNPTYSTLLTFCIFGGCAPAPSVLAPAGAPPVGEQSTLDSAGAQIASSSSSGADLELGGNSDTSETSAPAVASVVEGASAPVAYSATPRDQAPAQVGSSEAARLPDVTSGPAIGGPRAQRPCEFHESVDAYNRVCTAHKNADGSLQIVARGTRLNPDNGFEFTLHGGPHNFFAHGNLNAFGICAGPFTAYVNTVIDKGVTTYELRFKEHCKIVVR
jgi:hypothetical protein